MRIHVWTLLLVFTELSSVIRIHSSVLLKGEVTSQQQKISSVTQWQPTYSLKPYHNFGDVQIYAIYVPVFTSVMLLNFEYFGYTSESHQPCNNTIIVLLQQGSPAVPYRDDITTESWLYDNSNAFKTVITGGNVYSRNHKSKIIKSPLPGNWYVTTFLPYVERVKKITEKGLSKPDENCLSAVKIQQVLESPSEAAQVIAKNQTVTNTIGVKQEATKYYQYYVPHYSRNLSIEIKNGCMHPNRNCSLKVFVSPKSLPSSTSTSCNASNGGCLVQIEWPQSATNYYIEVSGTNSSYEITANHTDCRDNNDTTCYPIFEMNYITRRRGLLNVWPDLHVNTTGVYSVNVEPDYVGATLHVTSSSSIQDYGDDIVSYKMCIRKDSPPFDVFEATSPSNQYCRSTNNSDISMKVLFPQPGKWYIAFGMQSTKTGYNPEVTISVHTHSCLDYRCSGHGSCKLVNHIGASYGVCECDYGYSGWTCEYHHGLDILAICLLTISNIAFLPGIYVAYKRRFYPEAIVFLFNMYCSTVYHACDSHGRCIYDYNILQLSDFFASVLSVWYTLLTMAKLSLFWHRTINIFALLCIFTGIQLSRFGVTMIAVPAGVGVGIVLLSFALRSYYRHKCFPSRRRWLFFILPAAVLAVVAITVYSCLETTANYKYLHSFWHICIALSIPLLLPTVRKKDLLVQYNMIQQLDEGENFRESDDSLLLNAWNPENDENLDDSPVPTLVV